MSDQQVAGKNDQPPYPYEERSGWVWQPWSMGGGEWVAPQAVRLSDADIQRIAEAVVRLLKSER